jgi:hypothetical protein
LAVELCDVTPARPAELEREHLAAFLRGAACDGSFQRTRAWADQRRRAPADDAAADATTAWAIAEGAACDCELAARLAIAPSKASP